MSDTSFRDVLEALGSPGPVRSGSVEPLRRIAVLGAGAVGRLIACEGLAAGLEVRLHSLVGKELEELRSAGAITVRGAHLVGSYAVGASTPSRPAIALADSVDGAVSGADLVLVVTPAAAHATYAGVLAGALSDGQTVLLVPGRFLGSVAFRQELSRHHCRAEVTLAELGTAPYVAGRDGAVVTVHGVARTVDLATLPVSRAEGVAERLAPLLPMLRAVDSPLVTAFGTVTGVVSVAPLLTNTAVMDAKDGDSVLLKDLVPPSLSTTLIRALDEERREVAFHFGVRDLPSAGAWLRQAYSKATEADLDGSSDDLSVVLQEIAMFDEVTVGGSGGPHLTDDVPNSLVPLAGAGRLAGVPTPATDTVIALSGCLLGSDLMATGRNLGALGLGDVRPADARRRLTEAAEQQPQPTTWWSV